MIAPRVMAPDESGGIREVQVLTAQGPQVSDLHAGEIHIWTAVLDLPADGMDELMEMLTEDERERARQYYHARDRGRYVVARATLRKILASNLELPPSALRFSYGPQGKPSLSPRGPRFNMAHSGGIAYYAVSRDCEVGIDVEHVRPLAELDHLAALCFTPAERAMLHGLSHEEQLDTFFTLWTRKEAYLKAVGAGLSFLLTCVDVSYATVPETVVFSRRETNRRYSIRSLAAPPGFRAAAAIQAPSRSRTGLTPYG